MVTGVDRHGNRLLAWGSGPAPSDRRRPGVDLDDFARVGQVRIHLAVTRGNAVFGLAAERDVRD